MNRRKTAMTIRYGLLSIGMFIVAVTAGLLHAAPTSATAVRSGDNVSIASNETIDDSLFITGSNQTISGRIDGDVFCAGQDIYIDADITGDVLCAGNTIRIGGGQIAGDVRLAGQAIDIGAPVGGSATLAASTIDLYNNGRVGGDLTVFASSIKLKTSVARDAVINAESMVMSGTIGRDLRVDAERINLRGSSVIERNLVYEQSADFVRDDGSIVRGTLYKESLDGSDTSVGGQLLAALATLGFVLVGFLLLYLVVAAVLPQVVVTAAARLRTSFGTTLLYGLVAALALPVLTVGLLVTGIAWPLALLVGLLWALAALVAGAFSAFAIGRAILRSASHVMVIMLVGAGVLLIAGLIPVVGFIAWTGAYVLGLGMIVKECQSAYRKPDYTAAPPQAPDASPPATIPADRTRIASTGPKPTKKSNKPSRKA